MKQVETPRKTTEGNERKHFTLRYMDLIDFQSK